MSRNRVHQFRWWQGRDGKFEVEAVYVGLFQNNTKVKLRKPGGAMIAVPLERLSEADLAYVAACSVESIVLDDTFPSESSSQPALQTNKEAAANANEEITVITPVFSHGTPQRVRAMRPESVQLLSHPSLSSITGRLKHRGRPQNLGQFPDSILVRIGWHLDARTRVRFARVSKNLMDVMFQPPVWQYVWFLRQDLRRVDSAMIEAMTRTLLTHQLYRAVDYMVLDGSAITADAVIHVLQNFLGLRSLSIKECWEVHSVRLAEKLRHLVASESRVRIQLDRLELGKALRRGVDKKELENNPEIPKSFGQDVSVIQSSLDQLAGHHVQMDCHLCDFCHMGAAASGMLCVACGPVEIRKCLRCAPKCDR